MQIAFLEITAKNWDDFDHARWRVQFLRSLVQLHQTSPKRGTAHWVAENVEYSRRLDAAEQELARFPKEWHTMPKPAIPQVMGNS